MPATPMKLAALRYSPEMAEAFQPTETERPATKKSEADLEVLAERKPIQMVTMTVTAEKARIQGSTIGGGHGWGRVRRLDQALRFDCLAAARSTSASSRAMERVMKMRAMIQTKGKNNTPSTSHVRVNPPTRWPMKSGRNNWPGAGPAARRNAAAQAMESRSWRRIKWWRNSSLWMKSSWSGGVSDISRSCSRLRAIPATVFALHLGSSNHTPPGPSPHP